MEIVFVLFPLALCLTATALGGFIWSSRKDQFEDMETPAMRILFDDAKDEK